MACEQSDSDLRNKFLPKTKQKTRQISISNSPILSSSVSLVLSYKYAIEQLELLYFRTLLHVVIGLTAGSTVKPPPRAKGRSRWCIGQHQYLRLLRHTAFILGIYHGYNLMVLYCPSLYLRHLGYYISSKFWLWRPSKYSSTAVGGRERHGRQTLPFFLRWNKNTHIKLLARLESPSCDQKTLPWSREWERPFVGARVRPTEIKGEPKAYIFQLFLTHLSYHYRANDHEWLQL
jgi:hypothetical protein